MADEQPMVDCPFCQGRGNKIESEKYRVLVKTLVKLFGPKF